MFDRLAALTPKDDLLDPLKEGGVEPTARFEAEYATADPARFRALTATWMVSATLGGRKR